MTKHTRRDPAQYRSLLARKQAEDLTFAQLAETSGVPMATLQYWARKLRDEAHPTPSAADTDDHGAFVEVNLDAVEITGAIEIIQPGDVRVAIKPGFDPSTLRSVVDALAC